MVILLLPGFFAGVIAPLESVGPSAFPRRPVSSGLHWPRLRLVMIDKNQIDIFLISVATFKALGFDSPAQHSEI